MHLPYPGYSWSLTQHADKINPVDVYALLAAALASRYSPRPNEAADRYLVQLKRAWKIGLTMNIRDAAPRPWRDYQQILPELGLMFSTEVIREPTLTPLGLAFYDGNIGFDELITTQALRYQYPNGLKTDIQARLAQELKRAGLVVPGSRLELDVGAEVLIRPGVLVLRVLHELQRSRPRRVTLSVDEVGTVLLPLRRNDQWLQAVSNLRHPPAGGISSAARRNIQDWLRLLGKSLIFEEAGGLIALSRFARAHPAEIEGLLARLEDPGTFWAPSRASLQENREDWFRFFGDVSLDYVWSPPEGAVDETYITENYIVGIPVDDEEPKTATAPIDLRDFSEFQERAQSAPSPVDVAAALAGRQRQARSSVLHDEIVRNLGDRLWDLGYVVQYDPNSIDVYAHREGTKVILEVKTVGPRTLIHRLRLGTGQLVEYRRRIETQLSFQPHAILVIGTPSLPVASRYWTDVLQNGASIGLLGYHERRFLAQTSTSIEHEVAGRP